MVAIDNLEATSALVIASGVILIRDDAHLPETLMGGISPFFRDWSFLTDDSDRQIPETRLTILGEIVFYSWRNSESIHRC